METNAEGELEEEDEAEDAAGGEPDDEAGGGEARVMAGACLLRLGIGEVVWMPGRPPSGPGGQPS